MIISSYLKNIVSSFVNFNNKNLITFFLDLIKITLEEDTALRGFTPLMCNAQPASYTHKQVEMVTETIVN